MTNQTPIKVLLQTTIPESKDDWSIARFSRLARLLRQQHDDLGRPLYDVTMRDRDSWSASDSLLSRLHQSEFDELWLFAVDVGDGLTTADAEGISQFRARGGGLLVARDHMDLGSSLCAISGIGRAHYFHSRNLDPDETRRHADDPYTTAISWPNYHSGLNGDFQRIIACPPVHPLLADPQSGGEVIRYLPSHPHEGGVDAPGGQRARVIARGTSKVTGRSFNIAVAFDPAESGPAIAQSSFHHFVDYNWDPRDGCPSFVSEPAGEAILKTPQALADTHRYVLNAARWLAAGAAKDE